jgi:hypothetical protein
VVSSQSLTSAGSQAYDRGLFAEQSTGGEFSGSLIDEITTDSSLPSADQGTAMNHWRSAWQLLTGAGASGQQTSVRLSTANGGVNGQIVAKHDVIVDRTTRGGDHGLVRSSARARFLTDSILDELALDPAVAIQHAAAGFIAASTRPLADHTNDQTGQALAFSAVDSSHNGDRAKQPALDLLFAAGFCGFGAGIVRGGKRHGLNLAGRRRFLKRQP